MIRQKEICTLSIIFFCLFFITHINAQNNDISNGEENPVFLTMNGAISRALSLNSQVKASSYAVKKADWDKLYAWTLLFPTISFNSNYTWIDDSTFALRDFSRYFQDPNSPFQIPQTVFQESYYSSLDLNMPIFRGSLLNGLSIAGSNQEMAVEMGESTRRNIIFTTVSSYLNKLKAEEILRLQKEYLNLSKLNYEKSERLYNAGRASKTESLRWKVEYQKQKVTVVSSESGLRTANAFLNRVLNIDMQKSLKTENLIPEKIDRESKHLISLSDEEIIAMGQLDNDKLIKANASLKAGKLGEEISYLQYRNSYASFMPDISLTYSHAWRENSTIDLDDYSPKTLMVNFSLPLFNSFQDYTQLKSAYYEYKKNQEDFNDQLQNTRYVITETINKVINQKTQIELARLNIEYTEANYTTVEKQKDRGLISNIDFIDAKLNMQNARLEMINNQYDFVSSMVELYYLVGKLETLIK
ncbi:MAG: TolC family protein [Calditrichaeota bacterium]|nr:TolC family protein [Calditrichota bacterium]